MGNYAIRNMSEGPPPALVAVMASSKNCLEFPAREKNIALHFDDCLDVRKNDNL